MIRTSSRIILTTKGGTRLINKYDNNESANSDIVQVAIGKWNLERMVDAMERFVGNKAKAEVLTSYESSYKSHYESLMRGTSFEAKF